MTVLQQTHSQCLQLACHLIVLSSLKPHLLVKQRSRLRRGDRLRRLRRRHQVRAVLDREAEQKGQLTHGAIPCSPHQRVLHVLDGEGRSGFRRAKYGVERFQPDTKKSRNTSVWHFAVSNRKLLIGDWWLNTNS